MGQRVHISSACAEVPEGLIAGITRAERQSHLLEAEGYEVVQQGDTADMERQECRLLIGDEEVHICEAGIQAAESRLLAALRKPMDGLIARVINRRISLAITKRLMNSAVMPNHLSVANLLLGVLCGVVVALGGYWAGIIGAVLFQLHSTLDGVDGELARLRYQGSRLGEWLDTVSDDLAELSFLVGLTIVTQVETFRVLGIICLVVFVVTQGILYYILATIYKSGNLQVVEWDTGPSNTVSSRLYFLFRHDFFCFISVVLAILSSLDVLLVVAMIGRIIIFLVLIKHLLKGAFIQQDFS